MLSDARGLWDGGGSACSGCPIFIFLLEKTGFRHEQTLC